MKTCRKKRLYCILLLLVAACSVVSLVIYALGQNVNLYYTPSQLNAANVQQLSSFRLGGMVKPGSVQRSNTSMAVQFVLTDFHQEVTVHYTGILPALFREGQGIVAQGHWQNGVFAADQVLAKHDEKYRPPGLPS